MNNEISYSENCFGASPQMIDCGKKLKQRMVLCEGGAFNH